MGDIHQWMRYKLDSNVECCEYEPNEWARCLFNMCHNRLTTVCASTFPPSWANGTSCTPQIFVTVSLYAVYLLPPTGSISGTAHTAVQSLEEW